MASDTTVEILDRIYRVIESRRGADPEISYVARLLRKGRSKLAQKVGEEAVEAALAAIEPDSRHLVEESADLIFHLLVLWADAGVRPEDVWSELQAREGKSGIDEKKSRAKS